MIDWEVLRERIIEAAVVAVNATAANTATRAEARAPVRKIFKGGRQAVRFKTAEEVARDRGLRASLGLAPEIVATPERIAAFKARGFNPIRSFHSGGEEFGLARTIEHPSRTPARAARGLTRNARNRANTFEPGGDDLRKLSRESQFKELSPEATRMLSSEGRYELKSGRAVVRRVGTISTSQGSYGIVASAHLGGGLRRTIRVIKASADQYPVIEAQVVAGDEDHPYAKFQELGTRHNVAHPFLRPSLAEAREELPVQLERELRRAGR